MYSVKIALIRKQEDFDAKEALKRFPTAQRAGFNAVGKWHKERIIPRHFLAGARKRYNHTPRKRGYVRRKNRAIRQASKDIEGRTPMRSEMTDLVYTGNLRREATQNSTWTATTQRGRVNIRGRVLNIARPPHSQVDMVAEMTFMPADELAEVEREFSRAFAAALEKRQVRSKAGIKPGRAAKATKAT